MIYGYARVSTATQNLGRQIKNLEQYSDEIVIKQESMSGRAKNRPVWSALVKNIREGDTIVFDSVSRMSRLAEQGIEMYFKLKEKGVNLVFLKEPHINTETFDLNSGNQLELVGDEIADEYISATNKVMKILATRQIKLAFGQADKEVADLKKRVSEGQKLCYAENRRETNEGRTLVTKKSIEMKSQIKKLDKAFGGNLTSAECQKLLGIARGTYFKYKREINEDM